jgi:hypothetical protein
MATSDAGVMLRFTVTDVFYAGEENRAAGGIVPERDPPIAAGGRRVAKVQGSKSAAMHERNRMVTV